MMKKVILATILVCLCVYAHSQNQQDKHFIVTPVGMASTDSDHPGYLVFDVPDKTKEELYKSVLMSIGNVFLDPDKILSVVENNQININVTTKAIDVISSHEVKYKLTFEFRDNKIKVDAPIIISMIQRSQWVTTGKELITYLTFNDSGFYTTGIYKKGELKHEKIKVGIEQYFNGLVYAILSNSLSKQIESEW